MSYYLLGAPRPRADYLEETYYSIIEEYKKYNYIQNGWLKPIGDVRMFYIDNAGLPDWREWKILAYNQLRLAQLLSGHSRRYPAPMYAARSIFPSFTPGENFSLEDKGAVEGVEKSLSLFQGYSRRTDYLEQQYYSIIEEYKKYNYVQTGWLKPLSDVRMFYIDNAGLPGWHEWKILTYNQLRLAQFALGSAYMNPQPTYPQLLSPYGNPSENMFTDYPSIIERPDQTANLLQGSQVDFLEQQFYSIIEEYKKFDYVSNGWLKPLSDVRLFYIDNAGLPGWREWKILTYNQLRIAQVILGHNRPRPVPIDQGLHFSPCVNPFENLALEDKRIFEAPYQSINLLRVSRLDYLEQQYYNIIEEYKKYDYVQRGWLKGLRYVRMFYIDNAGLPGWREWKVLTYNQLRLVQLLFGYNYF